MEPGQRKLVSLFLLDKLLASPQKAHHPCTYGMLLPLLCLWEPQALSVNLNRCILKIKLSIKNPNDYNRPCLVCGVITLTYFNFTKLSRKKTILYLGSKVPQRLFEAIG